jgi:hypothetical protein
LINSSGGVNQNAHRSLSTLSEPARNGLVKPLNERVAAIYNPLGSVEKTGCKAVTGFHNIIDLTPTLVNQDAMPAAFWTGVVSTASNPITAATIFCASLGNILVIKSLSF